MRMLGPMMAVLVVGGLLMVATRAEAEPRGEGMTQTASASREAPAQVSKGYHGDVLARSQELDPRIESAREAARQDLRQGLYDIARERYQELTEIVRDDMFRLDVPASSPAYSETRDQQGLRARQLEEAMSMLRLLNVR